MQAALEKHDAAKINAGMIKVREAVDALEAYVPASIWPVPSYAEMLLMNA